MRIHIIVIGILVCNYLLNAMEHQNYITGVLPEELRHDIQRVAITNEALSAATILDFYKTIAGPLSRINRTLTASMDSHLAY
jgi:hypothetical protein